MKRLKACPKCGSTKIQIFKASINVMGMGAEPQLECLGCGYVGFFFPEVDRNGLKELRKHIK